MWAPTIIFLLHIIGYDIWFYISHLLLHTRTLWRFHRIHHEITQPTFTDTYTGHMLEGPFQSIGFLLPIVFYRIHWSASLAAFVFVNIRGLARHDYRIAWLIGNHHLLHHADLRTNYGEYWLDRLFGTANPKTQTGWIYV